MCETRGGRVRDLMHAVVAQVVLLIVLTVTSGVGVLGWLTAGACAMSTAALVLRAVRRGADWGPADRVTAVRAVLTGGVAALAVQAQLSPVSSVALVVLAALALVLDAVDGKVARRTGTVSAFGARFDMEVDAFLILVLSCYCGLVLGWWVLAVGLLRYAFVAAGWCWTWLRAELPVSLRRKVVAAAQGVVLTVVSSELLPVSVAGVLALGALICLLCSFGVDVVWLWLRRRARASAVSSAAARPES